MRHLDAQLAVRADAAATVEEVTTTGFLESQIIVARNQSG
jgi:hypothetical protein